MTLSKLFIQIITWLALMLSAALSGQGFTFIGPSNRTITPNNDGKNDTAIFSFDNPQYSSVTGKVYDSNGRYVANMSPGTLTDRELVWNGKSDNNIVVSTGVYIYIIQAEGNTYRGLVMVIR